jgi:hypothetical protein
MNYTHLNREALEKLNNTLRDSIELINRTPKPSSNLTLARRLMSIEQEWTCAELIRRDQSDDEPLPLVVTEAGRQALREVAG